MKEERANMVLMRRWFEFLDTDGSGEIGLKELEDPLVSVGLAKSRVDVRKLIQKVDNSDNGEVNFDEFLSMMHGNKKAIHGGLIRLKRDSMKQRGSIHSQMDLTKTAATPNNEECNSVVKLFSGSFDTLNICVNESTIIMYTLDLQSGMLGDLALPFPVLITAYRRRMLLNAHMSCNMSERCQGHSVLKALETTRREAAIQEEEEGRKALERLKNEVHKTDLFQRTAGQLVREDMHRPIAFLSKQHQPLHLILKEDIQPPACVGSRLPYLFDT